MIKRTNSCQTEKVLFIYHSSMPFFYYECVMYKCVMYDEWIEKIKKINALAMSGAELFIHNDIIWMNYKRH